MATVTSLGFSVFSRYDGTGIRRAQNDLRRLSGNQQIMTENAQRMTRAVATFGPVAAVAFGAATAAAAKAAVSLGAAAAGTGLWALAMKNFISKNASAQKEVDRLKSAVNNFGLSASKVLGQTLTTAVNAGVTVLRKLEPVVRAVSPVFLKIAQDINKFANGPGMTKLSNWLAIAAPAAIAALWQATKNLGSGFITLGQRLGLFNDHGRAFNVWIVKVTENFKRWANGPEIPQLRVFLAEAMPLVGQLALNFLKLAKAVIVALGPLGLLALKILVPLVGWLAKMAEEHPKVVQALYAMYIANKLLNMALAIYNSRIIQLLITLAKFIGSLLLATARVVAHRIALVASRVATLLHAAATAVLNTALVRSIVLWVSSTARAIAHRVAMVAGRVATLLAAAAQAVLNGTLLRSAALWLLNAARSAAYRVAMVATRGATLLVAAAQAIMNGSLIKSAALWLLNAARTAAYRVAMVASRVATLLMATAQAVLNGSLLRSAALWLLNAARTVAYRTATVLSRAAALLMAAAQTVLNGTLLRGAAAWLANAARAAAYRVAMALSRAAALLMIAAQNLLNASLLRGAAAWLLNAARSIAYRTAMVVSRTAAILMVAAQNLLNASLLRGAAAWLVNAARAAAYRVAMAVSRTAAILMVAAQNLLNASLIRGAAAWLANAARAAAYRVAMAASRIAAVLMTAAQNLLNASLLRGAAAWLVNAARAAAYRIAMVLSRTAALLTAAAQNILNAALLRGAAAWLVNAARAIAARAVMVVMRGVTLGMAAAQTILNTALLRGAAMWVAYVARLVVGRGIMVAIRVATLAWAAAQAVLNAVMLLNPFVLITVLIIVLVAAIVIAYKRSETFRNIVNAAFRAVGAVASWLFNNILKPAFQWYVSYVQFVWGIVRTVFNAMAALFRLVGVAAVWLWQNAMMPAFRGIGAAAVWLWENAIRPAFNAIRNIFLVVGRAIVGSWRATWNLIRAIFSGAWGAIRGTANVMFRGLVSIFQAIGRGVGTAWNAMWSFVRRIFSAAWGAIRTTAGVMFRGLVSIFQAIGRGVGTAWNAMWSFVRRIFSAAWGAIRGTANVMFRSLVSIFQAIGRGVGTAWNAMWSFVRRIFNAAWGAIRTTATVVFRFLVSTFQKIGRGVGTAWNAMWTFVRRIFNVAWNAIRTTATTLFRWLVSTFQKIGRGVGTAWNAMWTFVRRIFNVAWGAIRNTASVMFRTLVSVFQAIGRGVGTAWNAMWSFVRKIFNAAWGALQKSLNAMRRFIPDAFHRIVSSVGKIWAGIKAVVAKPINFVIGFVADRLIPFANKALSLVLGKKAPKINGGALKGFKIPGYEKGGVVGPQKGYAGGGLLPGYSPGKDNLIGSYKGTPIGLSGGEGILRPEVMRAPGMKEFLFRANKKARAGGKSAVTNMMGFANGGMFTGAKGGEREQKLWEREGLFKQNFPNAPTGFAKGGMVGGIPTAAHFDDGGIFGAIGRIAGKLIDFSPIGTAKWAKDKIQMEGFNVLIDKVLGQIYDNALAWMGQFGWVGSLAGGIMEKVVSKIVEYVVGKTGGGGGSASSVVAAAVKYIGKGDRGGADNNQNQFNDQWGMPGAPWCANFVSTCIKDAKAEKFYPGYPTAAVNGYYRAMKHVPWSQGQPGDLRSTGSSTHINIIEKKQGSGYGTIGGNQGPKVNRRVDHSGTILRPKSGAPGGGGAGGPKPKGGGRKHALASYGAGMGGGGGNAFFTSYWDNANNVGVQGSTGAQASGKPMSITSAASSYLPLGSKIGVTIGGKSGTATIEDLGPAKFVYARHPGKAVIDLNKLLMKRLTGREWNSVNGQWRMMQVGSGRTLFGRRLRGYADGGRMSPGELALVGERGPELFRSGSGGGTVIPNGTAVSGGGDTYNITINGVHSKDRRDFEKSVVTAIEESKRKKKL